MFWDCSPFDSASPSTHGDGNRKSNLHHTMQFVNANETRAQTSVLWDWKNRFTTRATNETSEQAYQGLDKRLS